MTHVAGAVFVSRTPRPSTDPVHILVAFGRVLCEIDSCPEHAANVGMSLVKALMDDCIDERRT